jgi:endonuclease III
VLAMSTHRTGVVWTSSEARRNNKVRQVCYRLRQSYGFPRHGNPSDSLDDLLYLILSNRTAPNVAQTTYDQLKGTFRSWDDLLQAPIHRIREILSPAGLSRKRTLQIRGFLRTIRNRFGRCDLGSLRGFDNEGAESFLISLPGVSVKVAKCVMMYTLRRQVLPVDVHVHRIAGRLGWTNRRRADQCHEELEALIAPPLRAAFHVACISHGRTVCRPRNPLCHTCCIRHYCEYDSKRGHR